ncbi:FAD-dependent oxidoreductase [Pseudonocardia sp. ICBG1142]|uniref:FAD-dependent oxidoreductase n=1 Tax=Pseudonocardia sp. ICBG1142 TaxID=2846760 RepID=UPI001CF63314|nr:FAD-dependent oxidoreductase [Pseudonocardia sp. ICBG1142]
MNERTAIIVGAGIGGLAAAVGLRAAGWDVTVFEQAPEIRATGAGISLWSNGLRALDLLGAGESIRAHGTVQGNGGIRTSAGHWLSRSSGRRLRVENDLSVLVLHRAELHECLLAAVRPDLVRTGATVVDVAQGKSSATVSYRTDHENEGVLTAALVVGADGIRSRVRGSVLPEAGAPRYAGWTPTDGDDGLRIYRDADLFHGPLLQGLRGVVVREPARLVAQCRLTDTPLGGGGWAAGLHSPVLGDVVLQVASVLGVWHLGAGCLPLSVGSVELFAPIPDGSPFRVTAEDLRPTAGGVTVSATVTDPRGRVLQRWRDVGAVSTPDMSERFAEAVRRWNGATR